MWYQGLLAWNGWQVLLATLLLTHITIISVTIYLHRHSAHSAVNLHPALAHFFRFWLWLTTGIVTKEWTAIHRKHHAKCETEEDPHSPVVQGIGTVLFEGAELYRMAATPETLERYGQRTPDDWIERNLYSKYSSLGIALMAVINLLLFGVLGVTVWAVQMMWIPLFAAGVINGAGHYWGYRNFDCADNARNLVPWGILIGGEELHNNHHTYPNSAKLSAKPWEFDLGWMWLRIFSVLGLAQVKSTGPIAHKVPGKAVLDIDTVMAIVNNRFRVMAEYRKVVLLPALKQEKANIIASGRSLYRRAKKWLARETVLIEAGEQQRLQALLERNAVLRTIHEKSQELQQIWRRTPGMKLQDKLQALADWCGQAEASGIQYLADFSATLKSYSLKPPANLG